MGGYILKRLISAVPVLLGITIIVFLIMSLIPGDPATAILGSYATPENVEKLNRDLGLDAPMVQRYFIWLSNMMTGDFGRSYSLNRPVIDEVLERFNATLILAGTAFVLCAILGILAGVVSAARQYGLADKAITFIVLIGISVPSFFLGMMMILAFAVNLRLAAGFGNVRDLWRRRPAGPDLTSSDHARTGAGGCRHRRHRAAVALGHAGSAETGFYPHRPRQGRA